MHSARTGVLQGSQCQTLVWRSRLAKGLQHLSNIGFRPNESQPDRLNSNSRAKDCGPISTVVSPPKWQQTERFDGSTRSRRHERPLRKRVNRPGAPSGSVWWSAANSSCPRLLVPLRFLRPAQSQDAKAGLLGLLQGDRRKCPALDDLPIANIFEPGAPDSIILDDGSFADLFNGHYRPA
jgi:hypothetical protein